MDLRQPARIVILGAGGHAREVLDVYEACNEAGLGSFEVLGFLADAPAAGTEVNGLPVLGTVEWLRDAEDPLPLVMAAIGDGDDRRRIVRRAAELGAAFHSVAHPAAILTRRIDIGAGCMVAAGSVLTTAIRLGAHVQVNTGCTIAHDCRLDDFVTLAPGVHLSGNVTVAAGANIGTGASVIQGVRIGSGAVVGAGAVVIEDIPDDSVAVGVPARVIRPTERRWADG